MLTLSPLHKKRLQYKPHLPDLLKDLSQVSFVKENGREAKEELKNLFPNTFNAPPHRLEKGSTPSGNLKIGVVFSGGQAAGGHNVIAGIFDSGAQVVGFLDGPSGVIENRSKPIQNVDSYRNQGGFDLLGSGRTKIETEEQLRSSLKTAIEHRLDGLVIIGGDDSNTNGAILAEYFLAHGCKTRVVGVPKTIDGDLRSEEIEISFGFDSACKTYAELIGNVSRDALSAKKYYHFIKLMGRSASHIALECAIATQPNLVLIGEERKPLGAIVAQIADLIERRFQAGKEYGVILIPEGLIEFAGELGDWGRDLEVEKDPHGNILVSQIETERFLIDLVKTELKKRGFRGKFNALGHFFGYEGRACLPTNFDANYCYALGKSAYLAIRDSLTGVICSLQNLHLPPSLWKIKAIPILQLVRMEERLGKMKPVIQKALVDINSKYFVEFSRIRKIWEVEDQYRFPGPIQFFGDPEITDSPPSALQEKYGFSNSSKNSL